MLIFVIDHSNNNDSKLIEKLLNIEGSKPILRFGSYFIYTVIILPLKLNLIDNIVSLISGSGSIIIASNIPFSKS